MQWNFFGKNGRKNYRKLLDDIKIFANVLGESVAKNITE